LSWESSLSLSALSVLTSASYFRVTTASLSSAFRTLCYHLVSVFSRDLHLSSNWGSPRSLIGLFERDILGLSNEPCLALKLMRFIASLSSSFCRLTLTFSSSLFLS
jgi:hypothetical protein